MAETTREQRLSVFRCFPEFVCFSIDPLIIASHFKRLAAIIPSFGRIGCFLVTSVGSTLSLTTEEPCCVLSGQLKVAF